MKFYICSMIKDEHQYLEEWIKHHLSIGFTDIYLYEDYKSESHLEITNKYKEVKLIKNEDLFVIKRDYDTGGTRQTRVYQNFLNEHKGEDAWVAFIDCDEYIEFKNIKSLEELAEKYKDESAVCLPWIMYGANGQYTKCRKGQIQKTYTKPGDFTKIEKDNYAFSIKSFANLKKADLILTCHVVDGVVDSNFNKIKILKPLTTPILNEDIILKHYITKSFEDYIFRMEKRGNTTPGCRQTYDPFFEVNKDMIPQRDFLMDVVKQYRESGKIDTKTRDKLKSMNRPLE